ncbi:MAG TPA: hypothetical protein VGS10_10195 [Terracidiphilus sp.]|nr:hypothetical protein [Terracidiphilus sp.]
MRRSLLLPLLFWCLATTGLHADGSAFDLVGPKVDVHVKRGDLTLPISETPNLLPGDRLWIHPDLPANQSAHFVLVVAFLRGATNPPPPDWFTRVETWNPSVRSEGVFVRVPAGAQQALLFLAPETGGDFNTLRSAVRGLPGSFVRAAQDLQAASWDRMRLQAYLKEVKFTSFADQATLKSRAEMAARSLGIKINEGCFDRPAEQQVSCLSQNSEGLVLDDANAQSLVSQLTNGDTLNLVNAISSTNIGGAGAYSPYIGAIVDTARILSSLHTAHFQYIPALALPTEDTLNLRLNMPPSFRNPKSVVVIALPPLGPSHPEPLHQINPGDDFCIQKPGLVLPAGGAPLVFATRLAHSLVLHIQSQDSRKGLPVDLPVIADPARGGLVLAHSAPKLPDGELIGVVEGKWGFDDWKGPRYLLRASQPGHWSLDSADESALVVGRDDTLHLAGQNTLCVDKVEAEAKSSGTAKLLWTSPGPNELKVTVPMKDAAPGPVSLSIYQYGLARPQSISIQAYADAASLERLSLSAGDSQAYLRGTRLDEVATADLDGISWKPGKLSRVQNLDQLTMETSGSTIKLQPGKRYSADVRLLDGRKLKVPVNVDPPRPEAVLLNKGVQFESTAQPVPIALGSPDDLPVQAHLVFFLKSTTPSQFARDEKVQVAAADSSFDTTLDLAHGGLMLEDSSTAVASLDPLKSFGLSAFGPLRARVISANGAAGDWFPLGTLVRLPEFQGLRCPRTLTRPCMLTGSNLFLAVSFSARSDFANPTPVPLDFTGTQLEVPHPATGGALYVKLRDDPVTVQTLNIPVTFMPKRSLASDSHHEPQSSDAAPEVAAPPAESPAGQPAATSAPQATTTVPPAGQTPGTKSVPQGTPPSAQPIVPPTATAPQPATAPQSAPAKPSAAVPAGPASATHPKPSSSAPAKPAPPAPSGSPKSNPATSSAD